MNNNIPNLRPDLVPEWSDRNAHLKPEDISIGSNRIVWWKGRCGHEWDASVKARASGEGCPICANKRIVPGINDLITLRPDLADEWSDNNIDLRPEDVGIGSHKKIWWHGTCGHEWQAVIKNRVNGSGCPYCSHNMVLAGFNDLQTIHPEISREWSERNYPLQPSDVTSLSNKKVWWKCEKGHEWQTQIATRTGGSKCPVCSGIILLSGFNDLATLWPDLAEEWSPRNLPLRSDIVNDKSRKNVWWECRKCGHEWKSVIHARVNGIGCPACAKRKAQSMIPSLSEAAPDLVPEWDHEKNLPLTPSLVSTDSKKIVWWKCRYGHSYREKIVNRISSVKNCPLCESEFLQELPYILVSLYASQNDLNLREHDIERFGIPIDIFLPDQNCAIMFQRTKTKKEKKKLSVLEMLCAKTGIQLTILPVVDNPDQICIDIREIFQKQGISITSTVETDLLEAQNQYWSL